MKTYEPLLVVSVLAFASWMLMGSNGILSPGESHTNSDDVMVEVLPDTPTQASDAPLGVLPTLHIELPPTVRVAVPPSIETVPTPPMATYAFDPSDPVPMYADTDGQFFRDRANLSLAASLDGEVRSTKSQVRYLEIQLAKAGSLDLPPLEWAKDAHPDDVPTPAVAVEIVMLMEGFRVKLTADEGMWLADRIRADDWSAWGDDPELSIIMQLGPDRLLRDMPRRELTELLIWYEGEGVFP